MTSQTGTCINVFFVSVNKSYLMSSHVLLPATTTECFDCTTTSKLGTFLSYRISCITETVLYKHCKTTPQCYICMQSYNYNCEIYVLTLVFFIIPFICLELKKGMFVLFRPGYLNILIIVLTSPADFMIL